MQQYHTSLTSWTQISPALLFFLHRSYFVELCSSPLCFHAHFTLLTVKGCTEILVPRCTSHVRQTAHLPEYEPYFPLTFHPTPAVWKLSLHFKLITLTLSRGLDILQMAEMDSSIVLIISPSLEIYLQNIWDAFWDNRLCGLQWVQAMTRGPTFTGLSRSIPLLAEEMNNVFFFLQLCMSHLIFWFLIRR